MDRWEGHFWSYDIDPELHRMIRSPYIMNADGTGVTKLIESVIHEGNKTFSVDGILSLSPDCQKAAFRLGAGDHSDIAILEMDSRTVVNLTNGKLKGCMGPRWSPDGTKIVFSDVGVLPRLLYVMNSDGTDIMMINEGYEPDWSPDGQRIAFVKNEEIYTMDADGHNEKRIAGQIDPMILVSLLRWSPDGRRILVTTHKADSRIYIMDSNGDNLKLISESSWQACWSPDGKEIAFVFTDDEADFFNGYHIWLMDLNGNITGRLTNNNRGEAEFDWRDPALLVVSPSSNSMKTIWGEIRAGN